MAVMKIFDKTPFAQLHFQTQSGKSNHCALPAFSSNNQMKPFYIGGI